MYCGACARDIALVRALIARGHDVEVVPLYTPLRLDGGEPVPTSRIFLGGINAYLQQQFAFIRRLPSFLTQPLDNPALLRWVSRFAISTDPAKLGAMTVSVLAGAEGAQRTALDELLAYLAAGEKPDVVVITNSMLSAVAPGIKARLGVPVVCLLQGEEDFIGALDAGHRAQALALIRQNAGAIDVFFASYAGNLAPMQAFLDVPAERIRVVRAGLDTASPATHTRLREPFTVGDLSVITPGKGLDLLVDAVRLLVAEGRDVRLHIAGKALNPPFRRRVQSQIAAGGLQNRVRCFGEVDPAGKQAFLRGISAFTVPSRHREARGMSLMEAQFAGVPVVAPATGVFPEMLELTGGGLLVPPDDAAALARALARLQDDPEKADRLGRAGAEGIARYYAAGQIAAEVETIFHEMKNENCKVQSAK